MHAARLVGLNSPSQAEAVGAAVQGVVLAAAAAGGVQPGAAGNEQSNGKAQTVAQQ